MSFDKTLWLALLASAGVLFACTDSLLADPYSQDFTGWSYGQTSGDGWTINEGLAFEETAALNPLSGASGTPYVLTPELTAGIGTVSFDVKNYVDASGPIVFEVQVSTNQIDWPTQAVFTNSNKIAFTQFSKNVALYQSGYLRIAKTGDNGGAGDYLQVDNIEITVPPAFVTITNVTLTPDTQRVDQAVEVSAFVFPSSGASSLDADLLYRTRSGDPFSAIAMDPQGGHTFETAGSGIPGQAVPGNAVEYYLRVTFTDNASGGTLTNYYPETAPVAVEKYTVLPLALYDHMDVSGSQATNLFLVDNYRWEGVLSPSAILNNPAFSFVSGTTTWGDNDPNTTDLPVYGDPESGGAAIAVSGSISNHLVFSFSPTNDADYSIQKGDYTSLDEASWPSGVYNAYDTYTNGEGWVISGARISKTSETDRALHGRYAILKYGQGSSQYAQSPFLPEGVGKVTFRYRHFNGSGSASAGFSVQKSPTGSGSWTTVATVTNIQALGYLYYSVTIGDPTARAVRIVNGPTQSDSWLCLDDITVGAPGATVELGNPWRSEDFPLLGDSVDVSVDVLSVQGGATNLNCYAVVRHSNDVAWSSILLTQSNNTYHGSIPPGPPGEMRYYFQADYDGFAAVPTLLPSGGPDDPNIFTYTNQSDLGAARHQDFNDWPDFTASRDGWTVNDGVAYLQEIYLFPFGSPDYATDPYLRSPLLSNGVGTIYFKAVNTFAGQIVFNVETSSDGVNWDVIATYTNSSIPPNYTQYELRLDDYDDLYVLIRKVDDENLPDQYFRIDDISISYPPSDVLVLGGDFTPAYPAATDPVEITCSVINLNDAFPAFGIAPVIYHRLGSGAWNATPMTYQGGNDYKGSIPPYPAGEVSYFIRCDFGGYYYVGDGQDDNQSPAFLPDAPETASEPDSFLSYRVRAYDSDYGYLNATGNFETATMEMIDNDHWQGVIDPGDTNRLEIYLSGFNRWTGSNITSEVDTWGAGTDLRDTLPILGYGQPNGSNFVVNGDFTGQIVVRYNLNDNSFIIMEGHYQDFNEWRSSRDYFEESIGNSAIVIYNADFDTWPKDDLYTTKPGQDLENFEAWPTNVWFSGITNRFPAGWFVEKAGTTQELSGSLSCVLSDSVDNGRTWPFRSTLTEGLKQFDFNYRVSKDVDAPSLYQNGTTWNNYRVSANLTAGEISPMKPYLSLYARHNLGSVFYEYRIRRHSPTQLAMSIWRHSGTTHTRLVNDRIFTGNLQTTGMAEFFVVDNNSNRTFLEARYNGGQNIRVYDSAPINFPGTIGLDTYDAGIAADNVQVTQMDIQRFEQWSEGSAGNYSNNGWDINSGQPNSDYCRLWPNGSVESPELDYQIGKVTFSYRLVSGSSPYIRVDSSPTGLTGSWQQRYLDVSFSTGNKVGTITSIPDSHRYLRWVNDTGGSAVLRLEDIYIEAATNLYYNDFSSSAANWSNSTGDWYRDQQQYKRPGYVGPVVGFDVQIASTNGSTVNGPDPALWTNVASLTASNLTYMSTSIVVRTWEKSFVQIKHTDGNGHLVVDDLSMTSWRATNNSTRSGWKLTEGWIDYEDPGDQRLEMWRSKAAPNKAQTLRTPVMSNSVGDLTFDYKTVNGPAVFNIEASYEGAPDTFSVILDTVTNDSPDAWQQYKLALNTNRTWHLRINHVSPGDDTILLVDRASVTDYAPRDTTMWTAYNTLITYAEDEREYERFREPEDEYRTCFLNNSATADTPPNQVLSESLPYVQSPLLTHGIGEVSFWYRSWEEDGSPPGTLHFYWTEDSLPEFSENWHYLGSLEDIQNSVYGYFSTNYYVEEAKYMRIYAATNGNYARVCVDNALIGQPIGAGFEVDYLDILPEIPLDDDEVRFETRLSNFFLSPSNITCRVYYHVGSDSWAAWATNTSVPLALVADTGSTRIYRTPVGQGIPAALTTVDDVVQYKLAASFEGEFADQASPKIYREFVNPDWYWPVNLNAGHSITNPYYYVFSCYPGDIWINEFNYEFWFTGSNNEYIEVAGKSGVDINDWKVQLVSAVSPDFAPYATYPITNITTLANETNGFGFWVVGDSGVTAADKIFTHTPSGTAHLRDPGAIRLIRSMGAYEQSISYGNGGANIKPSEFTYVGQKLDYVVDAPLFLEGTGGTYGDFTWDYLNNSMYLTPGSVNLNQVLDEYTPPPTPGIAITAMTMDATNVWLVFTASNVVNTSPWYATNLTESNPWHAVMPYDEWTSGVVVTQRFDRMTNGPAYFYRIHADPAP